MTILFVADAVGHGRPRNYGAVQKNRLTFIVQLHIMTIIDKHASVRDSEAEANAGGMMTCRHPELRRLPEILQAAAGSVHRRFDDLVEGPAGNRRRIRPTIRRRRSPRARRCSRSLLGARSVEAAIQIQTEYAKQAYEGFVAQATKVSELYAKVASDALKPVDLGLHDASGQVSRQRIRASPPTAARDCRRFDEPAPIRRRLFFCACSIHSAVAARPRVSRPTSAIRLRFERLRALRRVLRLRRRGSCAGRQIGNSGASSDIWRGDAQRLDEFVVFACA